MYELGRGGAGSKEQDGCAIAQLQFHNIYVLLRASIGRGVGALAIMFVQYVKR